MTRQWEHQRRRSRSRSRSPPSVPRSGRRGSRDRGERRESGRSGEWWREGRSAGSSPGRGPHRESKDRFNSPPARRRGDGSGRYVHGGDGSGGDERHDRRDRDATHGPDRDYVPASNDVWGDQRDRAHRRERGNDPPRYSTPKDRELQAARHGIPNFSVVVKGVYTTEAEVRAYFEHFCRPAHIRVAYDNSTGLSRGCAFLDFATLDEARQLVEEYPYRDQLELNGRRLVLEYARTEQPNHQGRLLRGGSMSGGSSGGRGMDWICNVNNCGTLNFARRHLCFTCNAPRADDVMLVEQKIDEVGQGRAGMRRNKGSDAAAAAIAAAEFAQQYTANVSWAPKEFESEAVTEDAPETQENATAVNHSGAPLPTQKNKHNKKLAQPLLPGALEDAVGGGAAVAAAATAPYASNAGDEAAAAGYVYDAQTGYYKDDSGEMYYDPHTRLTFHTTTAQWYAWDQARGQYVPATSDEGSQQPQQQRQAIAKQARVAATIGSAAKIDSEVVRAITSRKKKNQDDAAAAAEVTTAGNVTDPGGYRDRAAERRVLHGEMTVSAGMAAGKPVLGGSVKGKVYGGRIRTPAGAAAAAPGMVAVAATPTVGADDPLKASVQKVALERFNSAMQ